MWLLKRMEMKWEVYSIAFIWVRACHFLGVITDVSIDLPECKKKKENLEINIAKSYFPDWHFHLVEQWDMWIPDFVSVPYRWLSARLQ